MLWITDAGKDDLVIPPNKDVFVRIGGKTKFVPDAKGNRWYWQMNIKFPTLGCPKVVRTELVRYPTTTKEDSTHHLSHSTSGFAGSNQHIGGAWEIDGDMAIGLRIRHNGSRAITLLARQIKTKN